MLSRASSTTKLRRAKSSVSDRTRGAAAEPDHVDPDVARQHALAAATAAFERARSQGDASDGAATTNISSKQTGLLRKKESVRFTGPRATPSQRRSITRRQAKSPQNDRNNLQQASSGTRHTTSPFATPDNPVTALPPVGSFAPISASHRKLRKAKSMFTPRQSPGTIFKNVTPKSHILHRESYRRLSDSSGPPPQRPVGSKRSASVLRGFIGSGFRPYQEDYDQDVAIQLARDQYLRQLEAQRLKERQSAPSFAKKRAAPKTFKRTVRTSSTNSYGSAIASAQSKESAKPDTFGNRARHFSFSLKDKIRKVFLRPSSPGTSLPSQQIHAQRRHFGGSLSATSGLDEEGPTTPTPDGELLFRVRNRGSSIHKLPVYLDKEYKPGSVRSVSSASPTFGRSRVSSWTNSTATNTMTKQQRLEKKRLSIIQENGSPQQQSATSGLLGAAARKGYAAFRKPLRGAIGSGKVRGHVDSQRIFSALQKRLDKHNQHEPQDDADNEYPSMADPAAMVSRMSIRMASLQSQESRSPTVRMLTNQSQSASLKSRAIRMSKSIDFALKPSRRADDIFTSSRSSSLTPGTDAGCSDLPEGGLTYQQIAERNERNERNDRAERKPVREVKSAFFPASAHYQTKRISPYRRALRSSTEGQAQRQMSRSSGNDVGAKTPTRTPQLRVPTSTSALSESAYSRGTNGTPKPFETSLSLELSDNSGEPGIAYIHNTNTQTFNGLAARRAARKLDTSADSTGDWKGWMASELAQLENQSQNKLHSEMSERPIGAKHRRENAQIDGEDNQVRPKQSFNLTSKQPLAILQVNAASRPPLRHKTSHQMIEKFPLRFPLIERRPSPGANSMKEKASTSSDQISSRTRKPSETENERPSTSKVYLKPDASSKVSHATLKSSDGHSKDAKVLTEISNGSTPNPGEFRGSSARNPASTSLGQRNSPERVARLRRMQSSNTVGSRHNDTSVHQASVFAHPGLKIQDINDPLATISPSNSPSTEELGEAEVTPNYKRLGTSQGMVENFLGSRRNGRIVASGAASNSSPVFI